MGRRIGRLDLAAKRYGAEVQDENFFKKNVNDKNDKIEEEKKEKLTVDFFEAFSLQKLGDKKKTIERNQNKRNGAKIFC